MSPAAVVSMPVSPQIPAGVPAAAPRPVAGTAVVSPAPDSPSLTTPGVTAHVHERRIPIRVSAYATQIGSGTKALAIIFIVLVIGVWLLGHRIGQAVSEEKP
ncbi:hypothetical protein [Gordonia jinhuaensis]|nr:hypothetical protein [Gordonia jinhuaensis]